MACEKEIKLGSKPLQVKAKHKQETNCPHKKSEKGLLNQNKKIKVKGNREILQTN